MLAFDPELRCLTAEDYVFVPREDAYYYRALALDERGAIAEERLNLRLFLDELPSSPYAARARERLAEAEQRVDPRELEPASLGADRELVARALGPVVSALESCLPARRVVRDPASGRPRNGSRPSRNSRTAPASISRYLA